MNRAEKRPFAPEPVPDTPVFSPESLAQAENYAY